MNLIIFFWYFRNGKIWYKGQWENGKPYGKGTLYKKNGRVRYRGWPGYKGTPAYGKEYYNPR